MKKILLIMLTVAMALGMSGVASADKLYSFADNTIYWPTWPDQDSPWVNNSDVIGAPDIKWVQVLTTDTNVLKSITINITSDTGDYGGSGLFISNNGDTVWDYFADDSAMYSTSVDLYDHTPGVYEMSFWGGTYREDHPVGILDPYKTWIADFAAGDRTYDPVTDLLVFDLSSFNIAMSEGNFLVGFTMGCANDVFLNPVPEPATMLLIGSGLIGLAGFGRRKFFRRS